MEATELDKILAQADAIAKKYEITRQEALLLMIAHEAFCIHFHMDQAAQVKSSNKKTHK